MEMLVSRVLEKVEGEIWTRYLCLMSLAPAGKIDTINNICAAVHGMNTCSRADGEKARKPVWRVKQSVVHTDYADGSADTRTIKRASWCCPVCDWFVGEQVEVYGRKHNQQKKNFCDRCG